MSEIVQNVYQLEPNTVNQVHLLDAVKPVSEHSRLFKRIMAITFLEKALEQDIIRHNEETEDIQDHIKYEQSGFDNANIIERAIYVFNYPGGLIKKDVIKDYEQYTIRISMLDVAIGSDKNEIDMYSVSWWL
jgi:hypothetical protein